MKHLLIIFLGFVLFSFQLFSAIVVGEAEEGDSWLQPFTQQWEDNPGPVNEAISKQHPFNEMRIYWLDGNCKFEADNITNTKPFEVTAWKVVTELPTNPKKGSWVETYDSDILAIIKNNINSTTWQIEFKLHFTDPPTNEMKKIKFYFDTYLNGQLVERWYCDLGFKYTGSWYIYKVRDAVPPGIYSKEIVLRLDPDYMKYDKQNELNPFKKWYDIAGLDKDDAIMEDSKRQPTFVSNWYQRPSPANTYLPGVRFTVVSDANKYGYSDIMTIPYNNVQDIITSVNDNKWDPQEDQTDKSLLIIFKPEAPDGGPAYWSDGRQVLAEFGGPLSGFNIYIKNGSLFFGMWNRFESRYTSITLPTAMPNLLMAHLEYNADSKKFRGMLYYNSTRLISSAMNFSGITKDVDNHGVGGACRTRFDDYSIGSTYSCEFNGFLGDVMVYNNLDKWQDVYYLINTNYGTSFYHPINGDEFPRQDGDWHYYTYDEAPEEAMQTQAYPNPFTTETSFDLSLPEKDFVTVSLYDVQGRKVSDVFSGMLNSGRNEITINSNGLMSGIYLIRAVGTNFSLNQKVVLVK
ncbi:MAG: T9SS type A sorting domain-containing protein [Candidatus Kapabacteria bacterium]|nr:T9SS type A sorting domain-containing protein [Candidatus Kapabacteria bacterium]